MTYLISYDIECNKKRKKVSDRLIQYGLTRIQYSVFMGFATVIVMKKLKVELSQFFEKETNDQLLILPINKSDLKKRYNFGKDIENIKLVTGECHTLIV